MHTCIAHVQVDEEDPVTGVMAYTYYDDDNEEWRHQRPNVGSSTHTDVACDMGVSMLCQ